VFEGIINPVNNAMHLFDGGVSPSEAEQVSGINLLCSMSGRSRLRSNFSRVEHEEVCLSVCSQSLCSIF
jgi:hypothetical protein